MEGLAAIEVFLREGDGLGDVEVQFVRNPFGAEFGTARQRSAKTVAWSGIAGPTPLIALSFGGHLLWSSSSSQCKISADTALGDSS